MRRTKEEMELARSEKINPALVTKIQETLKAGRKERRSVSKKCKCGVGINHNDDYYKTCYAIECGYFREITPSFDSFNQGMRGY